MSLLLLNEDELRQTITIDEAIEAIKNAFIASAEGRMDTPGDFGLVLPEVDGEVDVKGTYLQNGRYYIIKIGNYFRENPKLSLPVASGLLALFDAATGFPTAILIDSGYLTNVRAGASGAIAANYLANKEIKSVAIIGSGRQGYIQLKSLMKVRDFEAVLIWDRSPLNADNYARRMVEEHDVNISIAASVKEAVQQADLIVTATPSQTPLIQADWLRPGVHITAIGSNSPSKQELQVDVLEKADIIIADTINRCSTHGEIHHALEAKTISSSSLQGELGSLIIGRILGRTGPDQITVADLTGIASHDAVLATLAMEKANFYGLGQRVEIGLEQKGLSSRFEGLL